MTARRLLALLPALVAAIATPTAPAADLPSTGKDIAYAVEVDGEGSYTYSEQVDGGADWYGHDVHADFYYKGAIGDGVVFRNGSPFDTKPDDLPDGVAGGTWQDTSSIGNGPECSATDEDPTKGWMEFLDDADLPGGLPALDGDVHLWLRPFEAFDVSFDCGGVDQHPGVSLVQPWQEDSWFEDGTMKFGRSQFDITFTLPRDIIGMGYIEQVVPLQVFEGERCPHYSEGQTTQCRLEWSAKIKLTKLWEKPIDASQTPTTPPAKDEVPLVPLTPPAPPQPQEPQTEDDDWLVPLVPSAKASLSSTGSKASFSVSCAGGCTGAASLTAGTGATARSAAKAKPRPLARTSFRLAKGQTKRVTLKLGAKARRAVKKAGGARIVVRTVAGGKATTKTLRLKLPRRGAGRR